MTLLNSAAITAVNGEYRVHANTPVHKEGEEGVLLIDTLTGQFAQPIDERPSWADGHIVANLADRWGFYAARLGPMFTPAVKFPQMLNYADLAWEVLSDEGLDTITQPADDEFRMNVMAEFSGVVRLAPQEMGPLTAFEHTAGRVLAEATIAHDADNYEESTARAFETAETTTFARQAEIEAHEAELAALRRKVAHG